MTTLIGTDEAGYGPNLGPLLVAGTTWHVGGEPRGTDLYRILGKVVGSDPTTAPVAIADSKQLYKPGGGLTSLEKVVLATARQLGYRPECWRDAFRLLAPRCVRYFADVPWYADFEGQIPSACSDEEVAVTEDLMRMAMLQADVALTQMRATAVFPGPFNELVDRLGNKGTALSVTTLQLVEQLMDDVDDDSFFVQCDKHGGRNRYGPLLQQQFPEYLVEVVRESRPSSIYRWGPRERRVEIRFVAQGERFLPAALASMLAKYLRELAMQAFNAFWCERLPNIRPTAGYPVDARRFRQQIQPLQAELGIADRVLWRSR
jgi:hypothetical protein